MVQPSESFETLASSVHTSLSPFVTNELRLTLLVAIAENSSRYKVTELVAAKTGIRQTSVYQAGLRLRDHGYITYESNLVAKTRIYAIPRAHRLDILCAITNCLKLMGVNEIKWLEPKDERMDEPTIIRTLHCVFASHACLVVYLGQCEKRKVELNSSVRSKYVRRLIAHGYLDQDKSVNVERYAQFSLALRSLAALLQL